MKGLNFKMRLLFVTIVLVASKVNAQNFSFAKSFAAKRVFGAKVDNAKNIISAGYYFGTVDFDPNAGVFNISSNAASNDIYVQKLDSLGNFVWAISVGSPSNNDNASSVATDNAGNIYVTGLYSGTVDFDPGASVYNLTSNGGNDMYLLKLNAAGNFVWAVSIGSPLADAGISVHVDNSNNVIVGGGFQGTVDFDPGVGVYNITTTVGVSNQEGFILKLNSSGNFIWAGSIASAGFSPVLSVKTDAAGNVFACGNFNGVNDFDMGVGTYTLNGGSSSSFILKVSPSGGFLWAQGSGGGPNTKATAIDLDASGNVYATGDYITQINFGTGTNTLVTTGGYDIFICKFDNNGNFGWLKGVGSTSGSEDGTAICVDASGNSYVTGYFGATGDFDPNIGIYNLNTTVISAFTLKLNTLGNFVWATSLGASNTTWAWAITKDNSNNIYTCGGFQGICDFDPGIGVYNLTPVSFENAFIQKLSQNVCSNMTLGFTAIAHITCTNSIGAITAVPQFGNAPYTYTWTTPTSTLATGSPTAGGIYTVTVNDALGCSRTSAVLISQPATLSGFDMRGSVVSSVYLPGWPTKLNVDVFNDGCVPTSGKIKLRLDTTLTKYQTSVPLATLSGDTLIWNYSNFIYGMPHFTSTVTVMTKTTTALGNTVCVTLAVTPTAGDFNPVNNTTNYCRLVMAAYDPNDIQVNPAGACGLGYILNNQPLAYTIRFQNTGSASASNIVVKDSLSTNLNISSVKILGSSHPMYTEVKPNNVLKFHFDNINLPDSTSNEAQSHGYVIFEVNAQPSLPNNTIIKNTSSIYFDFNAPVNTNTVSNTVVTSIACSTLSAVGEILGSANDMRLYPNPVTNLLNIQASEIIKKIQVINSIGQVVLTNDNVNMETHSIDMRNMTQGVYFIRISTSETTIIKKIIRE